MSLDVDTVIVIIHVSVNISSDCFVTDKFAVAIGMLYPALVVISSSFAVVYELALSSITVNESIAELLVAEIAGGVRKGRVIVCPDDVVITIPDDEAFVPRYVTPLIYVRKALSRSCNPDVSIVFFLCLTVTTMVFSGVARFSTLAIKNPDTLALTFRNLPFNLLHCIL